MLSPNERSARYLRWLIFNLRWLLILIATALVLIQVPPPSRPVLVLLAILGFYQLILTLLESLESRFSYLSWLTLGVDFALTLSLFYTSRGVNGPLTWLGLLPALTVALRRRWPIGLAVIIVFSLAQAGLMWLVIPTPASYLIPLSIFAAILWPATVIGTYIADRVRAFINITTQTEQRGEMARSHILREHARTIYEMASVVSATLDYEKVLEAALNFGMRGAENSRSGAAQLVSAVLIFENEELYVKSSRRFAAADDRKTCSAQAGILATVTHGGEAVVIDDPHQDPELKQFVAFQNCRTLMALPLRLGYETYGVVLYAHPNPKFFDADQRALFAAIINQVTIALQNAQLYRQLREEKDRLIEVQEEAQKKLARDLHDGPTQAVAAMAMRANFVRRLLERDPKAAGEELFKMEDLARKTTKEIRHMLFTLRPLVLEYHGLVAALHQLAEKMRETHDQNMLVEAEADADSALEKNYQGVLFYIIEEAVNNARKHAQAQHIWVRLKSQGDVLVAEIQDDGVGFNLGAVDENYDKRGSLGMVNMRERAEMLNGTANITSTEGKGTRITIYVPLTEAARERLRL